MLSENASIVLATTFMAGNGAVLAKVYDVINKQPQPLERPWSYIIFLVLPPAIGLLCGYVMLGLIETSTQDVRKRFAPWLSVLSMLGIGLPIGLWVMALINGATR